MIEFDKAATLFSERASDCTSILYVCELSKYICTPRFWVCPDRIGLLPDLLQRTSGLRLCRTLIAYPS